ncbi:hypothetical protein EYF80_051493 [Liparis tanakae]|uniref:Uncharacterized protein n=1 Tax=Liparis tanakae TaxID=230148 RepID=A0A4Z2FAR7_9TELE|nr:hypothetical protein EYF80_051493 [Liparis tanakae]
MTTKTRKKRKRRRKKKKKKKEEEEEEEGLKCQSRVYAGLNTKPSVLRNKQEGAKTKKHKGKQPHSIVQRRLLEGNITRLRGEAARDANDRVRSPLADAKDGAAAADGEEGSESTADDSAEERESLEESERSLHSDEEEEEEDDDEAGARPEKTESSAPLAALVVQCKVERRFFCRDSSRRRPTRRVSFSAESWWRRPAGCIWYTCRPRGPRREPTPWPCVQSRAGF